MEDNENRNVIISSVAREVYGLDSTPFTRLGSFESEMWEVYKNHTPYILRVSKASHRTNSELESEAVWINYLFGKGVPVVQVIPTLKGNNCFTISEPPIFLMLFTKANGHDPTKEDLTDDLIESWGSTMGLMHKLSLQFRPTENFIRSYTENILTSHFNKVADKIDPIIQKKYRTVLSQCMELPVSNKHYGLIHSDLHLGNFFVDQGKMKIFDFDDLQLGWFVFDIAISLYYMFWNSDIKEASWYQDANTRSTQSIYFLQKLIKGYQNQFPLPKSWNSMMPVFLELRQLDLYLVFEDRFGHVTDQTTMPYILTHQYKQRIINQIPPIPLDVFEEKNYKIK
jgi:amicoumacin kinase